MPTEQAIGSISYNRPKASTFVATSLQTRQQFNRVSPTEVRIDVFVNPDGAATRQEDTLTIDSLGNAGDIIGITIDNGASTLPFVHVQQAGDTVNTIASHLGRLINASDDVSATAASGVITITGAIAGANYTLADITDTINGAGITLANTATASGGGTEYKVAEEGVAITSNTRKNQSLPSLKIEATTSFFDIGGSSVPAFNNDGQSFSSGGVASYYHQQTLDTIQSDAGIARTN